LSDDKEEKVDEKVDEPVDEDDDKMERLWRMARPPLKKDKETEEEK
jgi:hypothetical protein